MKRIVILSFLIVVCSISFSQLTDSLINRKPNLSSPVEIYPDLPMNIRMTVLSGGSVIPLEVNSHSYIIQYNSNKESKINEDKPAWTKTSFQPPDMGWIITIYYQRTMNDFYKRPPPGPAARFWDGPHGIIYGNRSLFGSALFNTLVQSSINRRK
jgi:hypothetical protein